MSTLGKSIVWIIVIVLVIWGISSLSGKSEKGSSSETIKIGFVGPLTGDLANMGQNAQAAISIALGEINDAGGVLGKKLEVVYEDDACNGAGGANAISKLINGDKVVAVLGGVCSGATLGEAPIAEAAKIPQLSFCSTSPLITDAGDYIFRDVPSDLFQAKYVADYLVKAGKTKVSLLTIKNDWGDGLNKAFSEAFTKAGGTIVSNDSFNPEAKDFKTQLSGIKTKNPNAVYFASYPDGTITGLKQAHDLGMTTPFFGADAWDDPKIWSELGSLGNGAMFTVIGTNSTDDFKAKMKAKLGKDDLVYCSNYAYDGLKIMANAIEKAGGTDGAAIKDALYKTNYSGGVGSKVLMFDAKGDPTSAAYVIKSAKDGKATELPQ